MNKKELEEKFERIGDEQGNFILGCLNAIIISVVFVGVVLFIIELAGGL